MLMAGGSAGPPADLEGVYRTYGPRLVVRLRQTFGMSEAEAIDVLQTVVVRHLARPPAIDRSLYSWLWRCCHNLALNLARDRRTHDRLLAAAITDLTPSGPFGRWAAGGDHHFFEMLQEMRVALDEREHFVALSLWLFGMTRAEVATLIGVGERQVHNIEQGIREKLRDAEEDTDA
jgi:RNA polymerase sigma factor (sigma-70 family)